MNSKTLSYETKRILRLDASANPDDSSSCKLGDHLVRQITSSSQATEIRERDLNQDLAFIDSNWIAANFTAVDARDAGQSEQLAFSDKLIEELKWADHIVLTTPMYNFGIPATLKAWIDLVCRAGVTFRYGPKGPEGLLGNKTVDIVITTGGVPMDSPVDFVSGYLKQVFRFIGVEDIRIIGADQMNVDMQASYTSAIEQIEHHYPAIAAQEAI